MQLLYNTHRFFSPFVNWLLIDFSYFTLKLQIIFASFKSASSPGGAHISKSGNHTNHSKSF